MPQRLLLQLTWSLCAICDDSHKCFPKVLKMAMFKKVFRNKAKKLLYYMKKKLPLRLFFLNLVIWWEMRVNVYANICVKIFLVKMIYLIDYRHQLYIWWNMIGYKVLQNTYFHGNLQFCLLNPATWISHHSYLTFEYRFFHSIYYSCCTSISMGYRSGSELKWKLKAFFKVWQLPVKIIPVLFFYKFW